MEEGAGKMSNKRSSLMTVLRGLFFIRFKYMDRFTHVLQAPFSVVTPIGCFLFFQRNVSIELLIITGRASMTSPVGEEKAAEGSAQGLTRLN